MLRKTRSLSQYQRGGWRAGSDHQKHMMMNPTLFLYRFPGPRGPGPYTMKYWWTLGCFPTGREVPFRLQEFLTTYKQMHVPIEVEEWLSCFVKHPAESLVSTLDELLSKMEMISEIDVVEGYTAVEPSVASLVPHIRELEKMVGVPIPTTAVRSAMADSRLRRMAMDNVYEYREAVKVCGSTPHRRAGFESLALPAAELVDSSARLLAAAELSSTTTSSSQSLMDVVDARVRGGSSSSSSTSLPSPPAAEVGKHVGTAASVPENETADDEKRLIQLLTTFAEGSMKRKRYHDAATTLSGALAFANDDVTRSVVHASIASAWNRDGDFKKAEFHGREAALLQASPRGYANWATAVAYQDDLERADRICVDALAVLPDDPMILETQSAIRDAVAAVAGRHRSSSEASVPLEYRGKRVHVPSQQWHGLEKGSGRSFDNEFDFVVFNRKLYRANMDPTNTELGSVFRRTGDLGGHISTSKVMEKI